MNNYNMNFKAFKTPELMIKLLKAIEPEKEYPVSYTVNKGEKTFSADIEKGKDLTENQIYELYIKDIIFPEIESKEDAINLLIKSPVVDTNLISDGYHTFGELYDHRIVLFILACKAISYRFNIWKSRTHHDGSVWDGWFIMGVGVTPGTQISYHLSNKYWDLASCAKEIEKAPEWDGHTSADVLERLKKLI